MMDLALQEAHVAFLHEEVPVGAVVVLDTEELKNGKKLYAKCIVCHGKYGEGKPAQKAPKIAGQYAWYLEEQVVNIQKGIRVNKVMMPYVKNLSPQDISDISAYVAKLPWK